MKVKKGEYRISTHDGWKIEEGSYVSCYPFLIHRQKDETQRRTWKLSHQATGYAIKRDILLKEAKSLAEALKDYPLFLVPTIETFNLQRDILKEKNPQHIAHSTAAERGNKSNQHQRSKP